MTKKEVKKAFQDYMKIALDNKEDLKSLDILQPLAVSPTNSLLSHDTIMSNVNMYTREKAFSLSLDTEHTGPFSAKYTLNGSHMLIHNQSGFLSAYNTQSLNVAFETDVEDRIHDATWLHNDLFLAVAQDSSLYVYNKDGAELHIVRQVAGPRRMAFLPYHFLLAVGTATGKLKYLDTSIGEIVADLFVAEKNPTVLTSNPTNAVVHLGTRRGIVSLWAPAQKEYLAKINCHSAAVASINIDRTGNKMITTGSDNRMSVFDIRNHFKPLRSLKMKSSVQCAALSQRGTLAMASGRNLVVLKDLETVYMKENIGTPIASLDFCPFEDILVVGHQKGVRTLVVPGSGDPVYDSAEISPFMTPRQRQGREVRQLLDKIPYDMISRDCVIGHAPDKTIRPADGGTEKRRYFEQKSDKSAAKLDALGWFRGK